MANGVTFVERYNPGRKTRYWDVIGTGGPFDLLGAVKWRGAWRAYAFHSERGSDPILAPNCLRQLAEFCEQQTAAHRQIIRERNR